MSDRSRVQIVAWGTSVCRVGLAVKDAWLSTRRSRVRTPHTTPDNRSAGGPQAADAETDHKDRVVPELVTGLNHEGVAQLGEQLPFTQKVAGSMSATSTIL